MDEKTVGHVASIIKKCYSAKSLEQFAVEMGEQIVAGEDIFQALIRAGRAHDLEIAVTLVVAHIDGEATPFEDVPVFLRKDRRAKPASN